MDLEILKIASDTRNNKNIKNFTHSSKLKSSICGDEIHIKLVIDNEKIKEFGYQGESCVYCQASASLLSKNIINYNKNKANNLCDFTKTYFDKNNLKFEKQWVFLKKILKKKNLTRKECILLPFNALKKIVTQ